ncbi:hypothetical protein [Labrys neptuniae]
MLIDPNTAASVIEAMRSSTVGAPATPNTAVASCPMAASIERHCDEGMRVVGLVDEICYGPRAARDVILAKCQAALVEGRAGPAKLYAGRLAAQAPAGWRRSAERLEQRLEVDSGRHV